MHIMQTRQFFGPIPKNSMSQIFGGKKSHMNLRYIFTIEPVGKIKCYF